jgi:hypothetical protein
MTTAGWIFMVTSWAVIISLVSYCYYKTLATKKQ